MHMTPHTAPCASVSMLIEHVGGVCKVKLCDASLSTKLQMNRRWITIKNERKAKKWMCQALDVQVL